MKKIIFFQNCVSPHQLPYIKVLAERHDVTLVAPEFTSLERSEMGWGVHDEEEKLKIMIAPSDEEVRTLLSASDTTQLYCIFSGITGFKQVKHWLDISLEYPLKRGVVTEAPYTYRWPLWMHYIKFLFSDFRYRKYINYIFAIGGDCERYYQGWSSRWRVVPFAYCVETPKGYETAFGLRNAAEAATKRPSAYENEPVFKLCYVGSLSKRKNVKLLLEAFAKFAHKHRDAFYQCKLTIVGDGEERKQLERFVQKHQLSEHVTFVGMMPMERAREVIAQNQVLVLPSLHDGWGAVVNEALMAGTMVWCSNRCGAKSLIEESARGRVFDAHDAEGLAKIMWNDYGFFLDSERFASRRASIQLWAHNNIGAEAIARKMETVLK